MEIPRRTFLSVAAGGVALAGTSRIVRAETYPARPVHIIVGFPPGAASDINARLIGDWLSQRLGQQFIVDNRPGAGSNVGTEAAAHAPADGYTLLLVTPPNAINASLYDNLNFNFLRDIAPVASIMRTPMVMEVNAALPIKTVAEFIAYAKTNPGKLNFASSGNGTGSHVAAELFKFMTGVDIVHVPYRGPAQALTDLISGRVQVMFDVLTSSIAHIRAGEVRAIAVTTAARSAALPEVPTVADTVPGYEFERLGRRRCASEHAGRHRRHTERRHQRRPRRRQGASKPRRPRRRAGAHDGSRVRQIPRRRDREMGEGGQVRQHQARLTSSLRGAERRSNP